MNVKVTATPGQAALAVITRACENVTPRPDLGASPRSGRGGGVTVVELLNSLVPLAPAWMVFANAGGHSQIQDFSTNRRTTTFFPLIRLFRMD